MKKTGKLSKDFLLIMSTIGILVAIGAGFVFFSDKEPTSCYQETATEGSDCADGRGAYDLSSTSFIVTYVKPEGAQPESVWIVKHGDLGAYEIEIPEICWNQYEDSLTFRMEVNVFSQTNRAFCLSDNIWNQVGVQFDNLNLNLIGTGQDPKALYDGNWNTGFTFDGIQWRISNDDKDKIFEEAMRWQIIK